MLNNMCIEGNIILGREDHPISADMSKLYTYFLLKDETKRYE